MKNSVVVNSDHKVKKNADNNKLTLKQSAGDAANRWLEKNRSLVLRQTPVWAQSITAIVVCLGSLAVVGGFLFKIDEVVTVQGQLKSIGGTAEIETPAGGRIAETFVSDGDFVEKGQLLVSFDTREAEEKAETLSNLIKLEKKSLANQLKALTSQNLILQGRKSVLQKKLSNQKEIIDNMSVLMEVGAYQRLQYLNQQTQALELEVQLAEINEQFSRLDLEEEQLRLQTEKSIDQMQNELKLAELKIQYQTINSPQDGIVFDSKARKEGVISSGERILSIVPQDGFYGEVFVPNKDIGFVKQGQKAKIRIDAFPFTRYGELDGSVTSIAADALPPDKNANFYRFPIKLKLTKSYLDSDGFKIPLKSGMAITTNLKLRDKRVISLISDMLVDQTDSVRSIRQ